MPRTHCSYNDRVQIFWCVVSEFVIQLLGVVSTYCQTLVVDPVVPPLAKFPTTPSCHALPRKERRSGEFLLTADEDPTGFLRPH